MAQRPLYTHSVRSTRREYEVFNVDEEVMSGALKRRLGEELRLPHMDLLVPPSGIMHGGR